MSGSSSCSWLHDCSSDCNTEVFSTDSSLLRKTEHTEFALLTKSPRCAATVTHTVPEKFLIRSRVATPALSPTFCESKVHSVKKLEEALIRDRSCVKDGWCASPVYRAQSLCVCFSVQCTVRLCSFVMSLIVPGGRAQI